MNRYAEVVEIEIYPLPMKMSSEKVKSFEKGGGLLRPPDSGVLHPPDSRVLVKRFDFRGLSVLLLQLGE